MIKRNILLINKSSGPTSHDIVDEIRKITGEKRVGHTGTLDPFAEGLLIVLVGREATKRQNDFLKLDKEYVATLRLGAESDTGDLTGKINASGMAFVASKSGIQKTLKLFTGEIDQIPHEFSAIKIKGKKAYELARSGEKVELKPRKITIRSIDILEYKWPLLTLKISCSSGTYVRALARDLGRKLGCGSYVQKLVRTKIGEYKLEDSTTLENLSSCQKNNANQYRRI